VVKNQKIPWDFNKVPKTPRISSFWWYRFQNSITVRDIGLKFGMVIVLGKLEDTMHCFLPGSVHKQRQFSEYSHNYSAEFEMEKHTLKCLCSLPWQMSLENLSISNAKFQYQ
jgi:hypothetical protein